MKTLLGVIMILSGIALIIGIAYYLEALRSVTTADDYRMGIGAEIIGMSLLPFITSLGFYKLTDIFENETEQRKIWLEGMNENLLEIKKYLKGGEKE